MLHDALACDSHPSLDDGTRLRQRHCVSFNAHSVVDVLEEQQHSENISTSFHIHSIIHILNQCNVYGKFNVESTCV